MLDRERWLLARPSLPAPVSDGVTLSVPVCITGEPHSIRQESAFQDYCRRGVLSFGKRDENSIFLTDMCLFMGERLQLGVHVCACVPVRLRAGVPLSVRLCVCAFVCLCVYTSVCLCLCVCVCVIMTACSWVTLRHVC